LFFGHIGSQLWIDQLSTGEGKVAGNSFHKDRRNLQMNQLKTDFKSIGFLIIGRTSDYISGVPDFVRQEILLRPTQLQYNFAREHSL
jgi:hypothetical protein